MASYKLEARLSIKGPFDILIIDCHCSCLVELQVLLSTRASQVKLNLSSGDLECHPRKYFLSFFLSRIGEDHHTGTCFSSLIGMQRERPRGHWEDW